MKFLKKKIYTLIVGESKSWMSLLEATRFLVKLIGILKKTNDKLHHNLASSS